MAIQIGTTSPHFSDPIGLLSDCHRRVEMFLGSLRAIGDTCEILDDESLRALENALRYFRQAAPKHTADEEVSLFPRLRRCASLPDSTLAQLERLERDHAWADPFHALVEKLGALWIADRQISAEQREEFRKAVAQLQAMYSEHIELEDLVLFPVANQTLSTDEKREIGLEMAARRNVAPVADLLSTVIPIGDSQECM
jgi:hemerythrin-like domain-containing protein